jgi:hypothetical protein
MKIGNKEFDFSKQTAIYRKAVHFCADFIVFSGMGYVAGHTVNYLSKLTLKPSLSFLPKPQVNIKSCVIVCAVFIVIDTICQEILKHCPITPPRKEPRPDINSLNSETTRTFTVPTTATKDRLSIIVKVLAGLASIALVNVLPHAWNIAPLELKTAAAVIITAGLIYMVVIKTVDYFDVCRKTHEKINEPKPSKHQLLCASQSFANLDPSV